MSGTSRENAPTSANNVYFSFAVPEGPPTKVEAKLNTATSLKVTIHLPSDEIVNGIIRGYNVTYYEARPGQSASGVRKSVIFERTLHENTTTGVIHGLEEYTWHGITVAAFTSIGLSEYQSEPVYARTDEAGETLFVWVRLQWMKCGLPCFWR